MATPPSRLSRFRQIARNQVSRVAYSQANPRPSGIRRREENTPNQYVSVGDHSGASLSPHESFYPTQTPTPTFTFTPFTTLTPTPTQTQTATITSSVPANALEYQGDEITFGDEYITYLP